MRVAVRSTSAFCLYEDIGGESRINGAGIR